MEREHRAVVVRKLDRKADPALHRKLVADEDLEQSSSASKVRFAKPCFAKQFVDQPYAQIVELRRREMLGDGVEKALSVGGRRDADERRRAADDEVANAVERRGIAAGCDNESVGEKSVAKSAFRSA